MAVTTEIITCVYVQCSIASATPFNSSHVGFLLYCTLPTKTLMNLKEVPQFQNRSYGHVLAFQCFNFIRRLHHPLRGPRDNPTFVSSNILPLNKLRKQKWSISPYC